MNYNALLILLQLMAVVRTLHNEPCDVFGEVREVRIGINTFPQVCESTRGGFNWLSICKNYWDRQDADVWCKQLGYIASGNIGKKLKIHGRDAVLKMSSLQCNSSQHLKLVDCPHRIQSERCDYIVDTKCVKCDRDTQCSGVGLCDTNSGKCKCTDNSTCESGKMCKRERCECTNVLCQPCQLECQNGGACTTETTCECPSTHYGATCQNRCQCENNGTCRSDGICQCPTLFYGDFCQHKSCATPCPEETRCNAKGECVPIRQTRLRTEGISTSESVTVASIRYTRFAELTLAQKLILSVGVSAGIVCIIVACVVSLSVCIISDKMHRKKEAVSNENVYEEMGYLPSCATQEYIYNSVNISPYSAVEYDSVSGVETAPYYSTVQSVSETDLYDSIDGRFLNREYANINSNTPIEPYLIV